MLGIAFVAVRRVTVSRLLVSPVRAFRLAPKYSSFAILTPITRVVQPAPLHYKRPLTSWPHRAFHTSNPTRVPFLPFPVFFTLFKTRTFLQLITISAKTSLTLLPHAAHRPHLRKQLLFISAGIFAFVLALGADRSPNTDRWRFMFFNTIEEASIVETSVTKILEPSQGFIMVPDHPTTRWVEQIVKDISVATLDDARAPVRRFTSEDAARAKKYNIYVINDHITLNAMCAGKYILVYELMMRLLDYDPDMLAAVLAHEIAHSVQQHGNESLSFGETLSMLGVTVRGLFWSTLRWTGPFIPQTVKDVWNTIANFETETMYSRSLEREADLLGLKFMAKAGYNPSKAVLLWTRMASFEHAVKRRMQSEKKPFNVIMTEEIDRLAKGGVELLPTPEEKNLIIKIVEKWFGKSHPPSSERVAYMTENLNEAIKIYNETLKLNGRAKGAMATFQRADEDLEGQMLESTAKRLMTKVMKSEKSISKIPE